MAEKVRGYRCDRDTYETFKDAADADGLSMQTWVLGTLKAAADQSGDVGEARVKRKLRRKALDHAIRNIEVALSNEGV